MPAQRQHIVKNKGTTTIIEVTVPVDWNVEDKILKYHEPQNRNTETVENKDDRHTKHSVITGRNLNEIHEAYIGIIIMVIFKCYFSGELIAL